MPTAPAMTKSSARNERNPANSSPAAHSKPGADKSHATNFLRNIIAADLVRGTYDDRRWSGRPGIYDQHEHAPMDSARIRTRFPPEPNGYLHIGHAKSICLNFGLARDFGGRCHMRFDDTNPVKEDQEYVDSILDAVRWLGFDWEHVGPHGVECNLYHASDYFEPMYRFAEYLVSTGYAYVDEQSADQMRGDQWVIYPMYSYAHPVEDALENITHSICTLEFEDQRPFYDWTLERIVPLLRRPQFLAAQDLVQTIYEEGVEARREFALHCRNFAEKLGATRWER